MINDRKREFDFTRTDFKFLGEMVTEHAGIIVPDEKFDMFYSRLARRVRALNLTNFKQYCDYLSSHKKDQEFTHFINAITTNLTAFFREEHHFEYLKSVVIPGILKQSSNRRVRFWSAGCSTGEEPYSLAIAVKECFPANQDWDVKILATDIDSNVLATAKKGQYKYERIEGLSPERRKKWFHEDPEDKAESVRVNPELQAMISFKKLNLMNETWPVKGPFDAIFCRNVVIYFDVPTKAKLVNRYAKLLGTKAHLFIGHSESLFKVTDKFSLIGKTIYQKTS
jgi:chemotaxis protein methyltransferase CheR